jgi:hypothetical protein
MYQSDLSRMAAVTRDRDVAFTILFDRLVARADGRASPTAIAEAEQAIVDGSFAGSRKAYRRALARGQANTVVARAAIEDELVGRGGGDAPRRPRPDRGADPRPLRLLPRHARACVPRDARSTVARRPHVRVRARLGRAARALPAPGDRRVAFTTGLGSYTVTPTDEPVVLGRCRSRPPARRSAAR